MDASELYDRDFVLWTAQQAAALRQLRGVSNRLDLEHLAEEIEDLGKRDIREVESYLRQLLLHGLTIASDPASLDVPHWRSEIVTMQQGAEAAFAPSMRQSIGMEKVWQGAIAVFAANLPKPVRAALSAGAKAAGCPVTIDEIVAEAFDLDWVIGQCAMVLVFDSGELGGRPD